MRLPHLSRRSLLAGLGAGAMLPWLESLRGARADVGLLPRRLLVWFVPNGLRLDQIVPTSTGPDWELTPLLLPLAPWRQRMTVLSRLRNPMAEGEAHMTAAAAVLTGRQTLPWDADASFRSVDQLAAAGLGPTPLPSLQLTSEGPMLCGEAVSGMAPTCSPYWTVSWAGGDTPLVGEVDARRAYDRVMGRTPVDETPAERARRQRYERALLDTMAEQAAPIRAQVSQADRARIEQYLDGLSALERRLDDLAPPAGGACDLTAADLAARYDLDAGLGLETHVTVMNEIMALALQCDRTRAITYMLGNERSDRPFPHLGIPESHHQLSHHAPTSPYAPDFDVICDWELRRFAHMLGLLDNLPEGDGTVLDQTAVLMLPAFGDPHNHDAEDMPAVLVGGSALGFRHGSHLALPGEPIGRLHLTILRRLGIDAVSFGDGIVEEIGEI